jgi:hypothetical protein
VLVASLSGCSKKGNAPPVPEQTREAQPTAPSPSTQVAQSVTTEQPVSLLIAEFLARKVRMRSVAAGDSIAEFLSNWENILQRRSRQPLDLHFDVEVDGAFPKDHVWVSPTNRGILDELCRECDLVWTIASSNTIRISRKAR